jgi:hypothetical protein
MTTSWDRARAIADAVLYEGYLLYPYRASSSKNQSRWQFGVVGPPGAATAGIGEDDTMSAQVLVDAQEGTGLSIVVRFLQLQRRTAERRLEDGRFETVDELTAGSRSWVTWDEAVECELSFGPFDAAELVAPQTLPIMVSAGADVEDVDTGRLLRTRRELRGDLVLAVEPDDGLLRLVITVRNTGAGTADKDEAIATSMIGTHLIVEVTAGEFVSLLEPPDAAAAAVSRCRQHRCFPVLAGPTGAHDLVLVSPIILYDHPEIAEQSEGALYDSCEIDEILTLRVMTMTDDEKAQARATDPLAAQIIDRCDSMSPEALLGLHGVLRDPRAGGLGAPPACGGERSDPGMWAGGQERSDPGMWAGGQERSDPGMWTGADAGPAGLIPEIPEGVDWWDPLADNAVQPDIDAVLVNGIRISRGSKVRLRPSRRADAQDIFFAGKVATVTSVHEDVEGNQHVGVTVDDDPAADLHDWYGRYLYFAPDEIEPLEVPEFSPERSSTWK